MSAATVNDRNIERMKRFMFPEFDNDVAKTLWRMSSGSQSKAYDIIRKFMAHYGCHDISDLDIEIALGDLNNGIEVEWYCP